jgi:DNA-binding MarR family transcriptional regulator
MEKSVNFKKISVYDTPARSPGYLLWHISTAWRSSIETVLKPLGLTHPQFVVLASLGWLTRKGARVSQAAIGQMAGLDPNTTSQILRGLEQKKLIKRRPSLDSRAKNPILTPLGSQILAQALPAVEKADAQFFSGLNAQELNRLVEIFQKIMPHNP